jgi:hypothetical protein
VPGKTGRRQRAGVHNAGVRGPVLLWAVVVGLAATMPAAARAQGRIQVDARAGECPARAEVVAALEARLPGVTAPAEAAVEGGRSLELAPAPGGRDLLLRLRDGRGQVELERSLAPDARAAAGKSAEACEALAEAAALVVVRYLREIGYHPPAAVIAPAPAAPRPAAAAPALTAVAVAVAPAPRRWAGLLGVGGAARVGVAGGSAPSRTEVVVGLQTFLGPVAAELAAGAAGELDVVVPGSNEQGHLRVRAFPLRAAVGVPLALGGGVLVPSAGLGFDVLSFRSTGLVQARAGTRLEPAAELGASYLVVGRRMFLRGLFAGGLTLVASDFDAGQPEPVLRTPDAYLRVVLELGLVLWKNSAPGRL